MIENVERGIDYDLASCLEFNPQPFTTNDIEKVLAVYEGENDGDDWQWVIALKDGRFTFLQGGCDYTGWDCQSWATSAFYATAEEAARGALGDITVEASKGPYTAGLGHMITILSGEYMSNAKEIYYLLMQQLLGGKFETWREKMDKEFGL